MAFEVEETRREAPVRLAIYGTGGVGKSTIAAQAPNAIFIASEDGLSNIDARQVKPYPKTWEDILAAVDFIGTKDYETLAIDSLDWAEPLCWDYVCRKGGKKDIEAFGYGKGYVAALEQWRQLVHKLSSLRATKGMNIILIAHGIRKTFKNPLGEDYDHWTMKLHEKASGLLTEWCDVVGFCEEETSTVEAGLRFKALSSGRRIMRCTPSPAYLAKTRFAMPAKIVLPIDGAWAAFSRAVKEGGPAAIERLKGEFEARVRELADEEVEKGARHFLATRGVTVPSLSEAIATLDSYLAERKKAS